MKKIGTKIRWPKYPCEQARGPRLRLLSGRSCFRVIYTWIQAMSEWILLSSAHDYSAQFIDPQSMTYMHWGQNLFARVPELPLPTEGLRWAATL